MGNIKPWVLAPLELLQHAEDHLTAGSDFDKRMAMISFDNSIETSITTYLTLHPMQREGIVFQKKQVEDWLRGRTTVNRGWTLKMTKFAKKRFIVQTLRFL